MMKVTDETVYQQDLSIMLDVLISAKTVMMGELQIRSFDSDLSDKFSRERLTSGQIFRWRSLDRSIRQIKLQSKTEADINSVDEIEQGRTRYNHESYGVIEITTPTGGEMNLFGSPIKHSHCVSIRLSRAYLDRSLNRDWIHANKQLIEFDMSFEQWGRMLSSIGRGGTPCTLRNVHSRRIASPEFVNRRAQHETEFAKQIKTISNKLHKIADEHIVSLKQKGAISKSKRDEIANAIISLLMEIRSNIPYAVTAFNETIEEMSGAAKIELESFMHQSALSNNVTLSDQTVAELSQVIQIGKLDEDS